MRAFQESELVLATHNVGKAREIAELLKPYVPSFYSMADLDLPEPEETGSSFEENAILKAKAAALASGKPALADDSGLAVEALGGDPGIYSARWGGPDKDFNLAMQKVNEALERIARQGDKEDRRAAFICALALAWPDGHVECFEGRVEGHVIWPGRGAKGFGYDPIFVPEGYDITFAEMDPAEKHRISHRADAFRKLVDSCLSVQL
ncbi:MAG: RdgB/HAM1 family non-canonical purine NTP pyrophosphatase [Alphaproteobacteria bacterium]|nr:RdgB/HAM1 family non-canonical purine NTP pyrophosphatase [Alphaproteobacteria bacterium]